MYFHGRRSYGIWVIVFCVISSSISCKKNTQSNLASSNVIKIGEVQTLTGSEATFGVAIHRGIQLAIEEVNSSGGILGKKLEVITLDDQGKSEEAATASAKLAQEHVSAILGALASSRSLAMAPIVQKYKIPMISPTATNPKVTELGDYVFRVCFTDPFQGHVIAKFALDHLKVKKVAILRDVKSDYSVGLAEFFASTIQKEGGKVVLQQSFTSGDMDYKSQLTAIRGQEPQAIFIPAYYTEAGLIVRQARELGITVPLLGGDGWSSPKLAEIAGNAAENSYFSNHFSNEDQSPQVQNFVTKFKEKFKELPDGIAALGYDSAKLLIDAIARAKSAEPSAIRTALATTQDFQGVTGKIKMDSHRNPVKSAVILKVTQGEAKYQTTVNP